MWEIDNDQSTEAWGVKHKYDRYRDGDRPLRGTSVL